MGVVYRLTLAEIRRRPGRLLVTSLAVVAAAAAVVWVVSGYDALSEKIEEVGEPYHGRYDAWVCGSSLPAELAAGLSADPDVAEVAPALQVQVVVSGPAGTAPVGDWNPEVGDAYGGEGAYLDGDGSAGAGGQRERPPLLVGTRAAAPPRALAEGSWIDPSAAAGELRGVVSSRLAERVGARVGVELQVKVLEEEVPLRVVGVVGETLAATITGETVFDARGTLDGARGVGPAGAAVYLPRQQLERLLPAPPASNLVHVKLKRGADLAAFRARWEPQLGEGGALLATDDLRAALSQSATTKAARSQSYAATAVSLLAALFIIFSALSMGVTERTRELAVLRAVGLTRRQTAALVGAEALVLAAVGWLGGLAAGGALLTLAALDQPAMADHVRLGPWAIGLSAGCAFAGALAAAVLPAWSAARVDVVATLSARRPPAGWRSLAGVTLAALALLAVTPLVLGVLPLADKPRALAFALLGVPSLALGFLCLCPALVVAVERLCGPLLARALLLPPALLRSQLSSNLSRTVGTAAALTIGLGLFITIQVWGSSMLGPFLPGKWAPQGMVRLPETLPLDELRALAKDPALTRVEPLSIEQPRLADDVTGVGRKGESVVRQDNVIVLGCDPSGPALAGEDPLFALTFVQGSRDEALRRLAQGRHLIVPASFARATKLGVGDRFRLSPPADPTLPALDYTIAGVVTLPGWHFTSKESGLRRRFPRSAALMFGSRADLVRDFGLAEGRADVLACELAPGAGRAELVAAVEPLAKQLNGAPAVMTPSAIVESLQTRTDAILWGVSQLPLITLLVTALGVANAVVASVRVRRWELGVLRATGTTRGALVRLVLAEAILVGVVACALSLGFGFSASWAGVAVAQFVSFFGGLAPPMVVPWGLLAGGVGATLVLCLLAGLWPAIAIGRADALSLLQAGRGER